MSDRASRLDRPRPSFLTPALAASMAIVAVVGGLLTLREMRAPELDALSRRKVEPAASSDPTAKKVAIDPRRALPAGAWLIAELGGAALQASRAVGGPSVGGAFDCNEVATPERIALAVMPPRTLPGDPELIVAATGTTEAFRHCARERTEGDSPVTRTATAGVDLVTTKDGRRLLTHEDLVVFATSPPVTKTRELLDVLSGDAVSAAQDHGHAALAERLGSNAMAVVTAVLPAGWLESAVPSEEARLSPLQHLRSAGLSWSESGDLTLHLECDGEGTCAPLGTLLERFRDDLLGGFSPKRQNQFRTAWALEVVPPSLGPERHSEALRVRWQLTLADWAALMSGHPGALTGPFPP